MKARRSSVNRGVHRNLHATGPSAAQFAHHSNEQFLAVPSQMISLPHEDQSNLRLFTTSPSLRHMAACAHKEKQGTHVALIHATTPEKCIVGHRAMICPPSLIVLFAPMSYISSQYNNLLEEIKSQQIYCKSRFTSNMFRLKDRVWPRSQEKQEKQAERCCENVAEPR